MTFVFGAFVFDLDTRQLRRDGRIVRLSPKAFDLLLALLDARPKVLSKEALQQRLWPDTFVDEANLSNLVAEVRSAIGDRARAPEYIRTAHGYGYAFCGQATTAASDRGALGSDVLGWWLDAGQRKFPLPAGQHIIGRDPEAAIQLDSSTVSRRHAQLTVTAAGALLEDIGSKNGTFRGDTRITAPTALADGDVVRIGSLVLTIHRQPAFAATDTAI